MDKNGTSPFAKTGIFGLRYGLPLRPLRNYSDIRLLALEKGKILDAKKEEPSTFRVVVHSSPAGAIVDAGGAPFNGSVEVSAKLISAIDPQLNATMPGALVADNTKQKNRGTREQPVCLL